MENLRYQAYVTRYFRSEIRKVLRDGNIDRRGEKIKACTVLVENSVG